MKKLLMLLCCFLLLGSGTALAIPSLGVAPGAPGTGGTYYGPVPPTSGDGSYAWVFADNFVGYLGGGTDAFQMPASGGELSIWFGRDNPLTTAEKDLEIWLAADTAAAYGDGFAFDGVDFEQHNELSKASYQDPVYALSLGSINSGDWDWQPLTLGEFGTGTKEFWVLTGTITYPEFHTGDWMYAAILGDNKVDEFSPKTTSATVPEPATMLLLGTALIGLAGLRRRFKE